MSIEIRAMSTSAISIIWGLLSLLAVVLVKQTDQSGLWLHKYGAIPHVHIVYRGWSDVDEAIVPIGVGLWGRGESGRTAPLAGRGARIMVMLLPSILGGASTITLSPNVRRT